MIKKFCTFCCEDTEYEINEFNCWECKNCQPIELSDIESDDDEIKDPTYKP